MKKKWIIGTFDRHGLSCHYYVGRGRFSKNKIEAHIFHGTKNEAEVQFLKEVPKILARLFGDTSYDPAKQNL